ncbi:ABC transporter permease [Pseudomonas typographi]|uniref:ABC transporter permease n=1 Tax=Pseudomonas typographi TaxID=2715964 RepID=UPI00168942C2|nr:ABC transporter permease [Pseudomonas typographi]MBD1550408.1 ABC transporter permease [Pseudomonas typographi]
MNLIITMGIRKLWRVTCSVAPRALGAFLVLWMIATLTFFALRQMPGDPALAIFGGIGNPTTESLAMITQELGLDKPLIVQYAVYLGKLLHGDLGVSYSQHLPVTKVLADQSGATLQLMICAILLAWSLVLTWTVLTAGRRSWISTLGSFVETMAAALPQFWLAIILVSVFAFGMHLFPPTGSNGIRTLILPSLALAIPLAGFIGQVTRESLEVVLEEPFVLSARARGLSDLAVRYRHALRHSVLPGISLSAWAIGSLVSGAVVAELIFSREGLGRQLFQAVQKQDMPLTVGITLVVSVGYIAANFLSDVIYRLVDPRISRGAP